MRGFVKRKSNNMKTELLKTKQQIKDRDIKCIAKTTIGSENVYKV